MYPLEPEDEELSAPELRLLFSEPRAVMAAMALLRAPGGGSAGGA